MSQAFAAKSLSIKSKHILRKALVNQDFMHGEATDGLMLIVRRVLPPKTVKTNKEKND